MKPNALIFSFGLIVPLCSVCQEVAAQTPCDIKSMVVVLGRTTRARLTPGGGGGTPPLLIPSSMGSAMFLALTVTTSPDLGTLAMMAPHPIYLTK